MSSSGGSRGGYARQTGTATAGTPLVNGTPVIVTQAVAANARVNVYVVTATLAVTVIETGGQVTVQYTSGGNAFTATLFAAGLGVGNVQAQLVVPADPGTTITVAQATALTAGTANIVAAIAGG